jgi:nicotinate phosphoribosyltransferase
MERKWQTTPDMPTREFDGPGDALLVDQYELTMAQAYFQHDLVAPASFELFVRRLPAARRFLVAAGLEQALAFLESFRFSGADLEAIARIGGVSRDLVRRLAELRFSGDVWAMPEGTVFFADEPILRVTAPLPEAQLVETRLINLLHFQTLVASKAARVVLAAAGRPVIDFGLRRAHGAEAGLLAARATYLAGFAGTSNVLGGARFGIPTTGTMAHSFVEAHEDEAVAFERFAASQPRNVVLLIDTYDTEAGARKVAALAERLRARGVSVAGVRIDSGDLEVHARRVRAILDAAGLRATAIVASGGLDEQAIDRLVRAGAPIDTFAPGTHVVTSSDAPFLDCAYKLVEVAGRPTWKHSEGKATRPGRKQVWRTVDRAGQIVRDELRLESEPGTGTPLLVPVMAAGQPVASPPPLEEIRRRAADGLASLPPPLRSVELGAVPAPPLLVSPAIEALARPALR